MPNGPAQAGRGNDVGMQTEARSRPCLQPDGWNSSFLLRRVGIRNIDQTDPNLVADLDVWLSPADVLSCSADEASNTELEGCGGRSSSIFVGLSTAPAQDSA